MQDYHFLSFKLLCAIHGADMAYYMKLGKNNVTCTEVSIMYLLDNTNICSQKDIVNTMCIPATTINTIIKNWEKQGYIIQEQIKGKKREKQIVLTELGREYLDKTLSKLYKLEELAMKKTLDKYSPEFIEAMDYYKNCLKEAFNEQE
ncbi:MAG: MarR family transcriptional regulator [Clostridia bacterium]|nr:MarR family transcriptional regulator [Clostridia bacterium]